MGNLHGKMLFHLSVGPLDRDLQPLFSKMICICSMVLVYLPTKLGDYVRAVLLVQIPSTHASHVGEKPRPNCCGGDFFPMGPPRIRLTTSPAVSTHARYSFLDLISFAMQRHPHAAQVQVLWALFAVEIGCMDRCWFDRDGGQRDWKVRKQH